MDSPFQVQSLVDNPYKETSVDSLKKNSFIVVYYNLSYIEIIDFFRYVIVRTRYRIQILLPCHPSLVSGISSKYSSI